MLIRCVTTTLGKIQDIFIIPESSLCPILVSIYPPCEVTIVLIRFT